MAWNNWWIGAVVCQSSWRIWCYTYDSWKYTWKNSNYANSYIFAVEGGDMNKAMMWVMIIVAISIAMILLLNYWSEFQQKIIGKRCG